MLLEILYFSICIMLIKSVKRHPGQEVLLKPNLSFGNHDGSCLGLWLLKDYVFATQPCFFQSYLGPRMVVLLFHVSTPAWILPPTPHSSPAYCFEW